MIKLDKQTFKKYLESGIIKEVDGKVYTRKGVEVYNYGKPKAKVSKPKASSK